MTKRSANARKAEVRASELIAAHKITSPPVGIEEICEALGLDVVYEPLPADTSSVLIRQPTGRRVIGVNSRHAPRRQRFSLAHELGHALLHVSEDPPHSDEAVVSRPLEILYRDGLAGQGTDAVEIAANNFAAALLMPADLVRARYTKRWRAGTSRHLGEVVEELADDFDVSEQAMRFRLMNLGLIDPA